ncbi:MAG: hypothetical protein AAB515_03905 [Patescibacteria group bacterium]
MSTDQEKINLELSHLDENQKRLYAEALAEGYKDKVCSECGIVLLAFHHFIRCGSETCPEKIRGADGKAQSLLDMALKPDAKS